MLKKRILNLLRFYLYQTIRPSTRTIKVSPYMLRLRYIFSQNMSLTIVSLQFNWGFHSFIHLVQAQLGPRLSWSSLTFNPQYKIFLQICFSSEIKCHEWRFFMLNWRGRGQRDDAAQNMIPNSKGIFCKTIMWIHSTKLKRQR